MEHLTQRNAHSSWIGEIVEENRHLCIRPLLANQGGEAPLGEAPDRLESGAIVIARLRNSGSEADVVRILAAAGSPKARLYRLTSSFKLDPLYPQEVHQEVEALSAASGIDDPALEDLEDLPFVTIDNVDSRDLDQALYICRGPVGFLVYYALADAAYYVRPGSALFAEALDRGSSYYLPGFSLPMLPRALSEDLISLNQGERRRSLVFIMDLDDQGNCTDTRIVLARICSRRKLSYQRVQRSWDDPWGSGFRDEPFAESLNLLREVGHLRIAEAIGRHVVDYHRIEVSVRVSAEGEFVVTSRDRLDVERCNEQISLLCNVEGAALLERGRGLEHVQPIFRLHPAPGPERLKNFEEQVAALVNLHGLDERWLWRRSGKPLDEYLRALPRAGRPRVAEAIERQAILTNRRSLFGEIPGPHHGIGAAVYARFSSPMREIVGIFTHKEALELLSGGQSAEPNEDDIALREQVVHAGNRSKALQRTLEKEARRLVLDQLFSTDYGLELQQRPVRRGTLVGMKSHVLYFRLDDPPIEVKIHLRDLERLTGVRWRPDALLVEARPPEDSDLKPLRVGSAISLQLVDYQAKRRRWVLAPL